MKRRNFLQYASTATAASVLSVSPAVQAQAFPSKPIRIICPYPPGATTDAVSRLMANALQTESGATVIVDNRSGAGGNIGTESVARGEADGHTLLLGALGPLAANPALYPKLNFDPARDFTPLALAASVPLIWAVHPSFAATTLKEALELLRRSPGKFSYASAGNGTPQHLAGELVKQQTGTSILHIPYRGSAPALNDVLGGTVHMVFEATPAILQHVQSGRLKALAVTAARRIPSLPNVPTLKESGVDADIGGWYGFLAPAATPADRTRWLVTHMSAALASKATQDKLAELGSVRIDSSPDAFARLMTSERARWQKLIRDVGIRID
ncbi:tripartite-type tricarboxylate transporter receptor subunit TctC [Variovorax boronicumulans]|uniref:Bug family tripartite tricarboxylate transporter substrate binding protein n=1 Tax=Variovorax boronicumulans TaxID=436515 RepID=UPI0027829B31|nr:tripartite tricarboxylate transporter substrate binding protein [Variovorax boronicumulans]MDP9917465.1 tripartite-type tricarboxylate transporter receptor subunit TctC [Variovorax boronicumulans]